MIPAGCPEEMATELHHCVNTLGCKAAHLVSYTLDKQMDDPAFFPFYEAAQELDIPLFCHPSTLGAPGTLINRQTHFFPMHILGRPLNCVAPLVAMVLGGVFEKFPRLKVVFFEVTAEFLFSDAPHGRRLRSHQGSRHVSTAHHGAFGVCAPKLLHQLRSG
jgi:predicted TIM-barrel fold metal-dependent hydrolase